MRQCALLIHTEKLAELAQELNPNGPTTAGHRRCSGKPGLAVDQLTMHETK